MPDQDIADQIVQYVMTIPDEGLSGLTVSKLAYHFEIDRCKLSRDFKKQKNMTLDKFLTKEKMFRAAYYLVSDQETSIKDVSRKIGFCTSDYFIRVFRDYYGTVPGRYRELKCTEPSERSTDSLKNGSIKNCAHCRFNGRNGSKF